MEIVVRFPKVADEGPCARLAALSMDPEAAVPFVAAPFR